MAHRAAVAQEIALAEPNVDGEIAVRRDGVLFQDDVAGEIIDLGPLANRGSLISIRLPMSRISCSSVSSDTGPASCKHAVKTARLK